MKRTDLIHTNLVVSSALINVMRLLIWLLLLGVCIMGLFHDGSLSRSIGLLFLYATVDMFFRIKIGRTYPTKLMTQSDDISENASHEALRVWESGHDGYSVVRGVVRNATGRFLLRKADIQPNELQEAPCTKEELMRYALRIGAQRKGRYVTTGDLLSAYLLCTEEKTKLLFSKKLHESDLAAIVSWTILVDPTEERSAIVWSQYSGDGIGELLVFGWTPETQKYTTDLTPIALSHHFPLLGRETEWNLMLSGLQKPEDNNVLILGESGVGKEQLVRELAYESVKGMLPSAMNHARVLELRIGQLLAGATDQSKMEERLNALIAEVSHAGNVFLYIPDLEHILGSAAFHMDLSGALLPYLRDGSLSIIASMTPESYKKYVEGKGMADIFTVVRIEEKDAEGVRQMLFEKAQDIESKSGVSLSYGSIMASISYAKRYKIDTVLPGAAIHLLEDAVTTVKSGSTLTAGHVVSYVETQTHVPIGAPSDREKAQLLDLEKTLHRRVIGQDAAVNALAGAMRRIRTGLNKPDVPISFLFLGPTGVGKTETAKALAEAYFGGEEHIVRLDMSEYSGADALNRLLGASTGENEGHSDFIEKLRDHQATLLLLDEFEKASREVHNLFLQVLADGRLTDAKGRTVHLQSTIIVATSNAGAEYIREYLKAGNVFDDRGQHALLEYLQTEHIFTPELLNRFDSVVVFRPLSGRDGVQVVKLLLSELSNLLSNQDISLSFSDDVAEKIAQEGMDPQFGARPLRRFITDTIEDQIAKEELTGEVHRGSQVHLGIENGNVVLKG